MTVRQTNVLTWQLPLPSIHCFPLNIPARVPTIPEGPSYKDSLLSGKDFLSVFVRSSHRVASSSSADSNSSEAGRQVPPTPVTRVPSSTTENVSSESVTAPLDEKDCTEGDLCKPRVISVRVSSSVSGTTPRAELEISESSSTLPTTSPIRSIFTSFLDAFAESSRRSRPTTPSPSTVQRQNEEDAVTYEVSVSRGFSASEVEEEGSAAEEGRRVEDIFVPLTPNSRYEFSPPDRLQFTSLTPSASSSEAIQEKDQPYQPNNSESYDLNKSYNEEGLEIKSPIAEKVDSALESTSISLLEEKKEGPLAQEEKESLEPINSSTRDRLQYSTDHQPLSAKIDSGSNFKNRYQSLRQSVLAQGSDEEDSGEIPEEVSSQEVSFSPSLQQQQRRRQKSLFHHYLRHQFPRDSGFVSGSRQRDSAPFEQHFADNEAKYLAPEGPHSHQEPQEMNYEVAEEVSVMSRGRVHGLQPTSSSPVTGGPESLRGFDRDLDARKAAAANQKFGYVVEGRNYRKYRVEERTSDGFIVGEYGVVNHDDGVLRGVRYTADGTINPRLIYEALMKFLSL
ncbi:hypothetical protein J437_LFUL006049 [Ladona fulva]|uniref:Uncharacterized protein n=1 Tax=Ladona fulva TaxID=123851 RepID=A0A8K0K080_LADFU|nr:hypothetical protein J437_LFUL006049 [Ladona fulva]